MKNNYSFRSVRPWRELPSLGVYLILSVLLFQFHYYFPRSIRIYVGVSSHWASPWWWPLSKFIPCAHSAWYCRIWNALWTTFTAGSCVDTNLRLVGGTVLRRTFPDHSEHAILLKRNYFELNERDRIYTYIQTYIMVKYWVCSSVMGWSSLNGSQFCVKLNTNTLYSVYTRLLYL